MVPLGCLRAPPEPLHNLEPPFLPLSRSRGGGDGSSRRRCLRLAAAALVDRMDPGGALLQKSFLEAGIPTALEISSWLMEAFTEAVGQPPRLLHSSDNRHFSCSDSRRNEDSSVSSHTCPVRVGIRSIRVFRFGLFVFCEFRVSKNENRNFKDKIRNRTRIDRIFRFGLFGPPN